MPQLFVTFTFGDSDAPFIHFQHVDDLKDDLFCHFALPSLDERARFVEANPVHVARMYQVLIRAIIKGLLGWDTDAHAAIPGGGVFGVPRYFYLVNECQNKGSLHCHGIIWS